MSLFKKNNSQKQSKASPATSSEGDPSWQAVEQDALESLGKELKLNKRKCANTESFFKHLESTAKNPKKAPKFSPEGIKALHSLAESLEWQGKSQQAMQACLTLEEQTHNQQSTYAHARVAALAGLARIYQEKTDYGNAEVYWIAAVDLAQEELEQELPLLLNLLESTGTMYWHAGHAQQAQQIYEQTLSLYNELEQENPGSIQQAGLSEDRLIVQGYFACVLYGNEKLKDACKEFQAFIEGLGKIQAQQVEAMRFILSSAQEAFAKAKLSQQEQLAQALQLSL